MTSEANVLIHWKGLENDPEVHEHLHSRCLHVAAEFPETDHYELSIEPSGHDVKCHGHVNGKQTQLAAHTEGLPTPRQVADSVIDKLERELRKEHDKRIFGRRRKAQREIAKKRVQPVE